MEIKQGTTQDLQIKLKYPNTDFDIEIIKEVIFTFNDMNVQKTYPTEVQYENGVFFVPLNQQNTQDLYTKKNRLEAQIIYVDGKTTKTKIFEFYVPETLYTKEVE